ncbi:bacteriohopanetetrol glucosamine biosynthesis glycosyltransferase HpnI [Sphingomonas bacterium]|uniref:bacteriohopanetetrol glucosamine biosynthesis glycosyltransferase HpnI n=1 Tax=Sphingomonas bacterium TaxID=1895847 RepID=UPI0015766245|nr:bacteriohopanetetrol glucosamine biosynthesis glycosyltransferase HpnI [Sphingomonas bacterium]
MATILAWLLCALAIGGIGANLHSALGVARLARRRQAPGAAVAVSLLKPLHGAVPGLAEKLAGFLDQEWEAPIQMVCGLQREDDPARQVLAGLRRSHPLLRHSRLRGDDEKREMRELVEIVDPKSHGANAKIANLINMLPAARHDLIVLSDDDMAVPREYLAGLGGALAEPGVGAATCFYRGRGATGGWSQFAAAATSYHFLPSVVLSQTLGFAHPCMGSTIALRSETLEAIGGFARFADVLADDYEIGRAVRGLGLKVVLPPMLLVHDFPEASLRALWRHELRWSVTLRAVDPLGNAGMVFTYPLPFALALLPLMPRLGAVLVCATLAARLLLKRAVDGWAGASTCPFWMLPFRDILSLALYLRAFVARSVDWRGQQLVMAGKGRVMAQAESPSR